MVTTKVKNRLNSQASNKPEFGLDTLRIRVVGITPLLMNNPANMKGSTTAAARKKTESSSPEQEVAAKCYRDEEGHFAVPNQSLCIALIHAAELLKLRIGTGKFAPAVANLLMDGMFPDHEVQWAKLVEPKTGKALTEYEVDTRRGVNPSTNGGVLINRPKFFPWCATFSLRIDSGNSDLSSILSSHLPEIITAAGVQVGILDGRAYVKTSGKRRPGLWFGKFRGEVVD